LFAVPLGIFMAGRTEISLAFIGTVVLFLPLFVFLPKLIRRGMRVDMDAAIDAFGKNEQVKKVFWALFCCDGGAGAGPGAGPCDSSADYWDNHVGGAVIFLDLHRKNEMGLGRDTDLVMSHLG
jgi:hypothetical protein